MSTRSYLPELEGLRGLAAVWVLFLHIGNLTGIRVWFFSWGGLGVDLFILLSGFLMVHQYEQRKATQPWTSARTIRDFWCRRFFRIAPLYYPLLILSFLGLPILKQCDLFIMAHSIGTNGFYSDTSAKSLLLHLSFIFAAIPGYSSNTALPDWTLGLEMQFYLVFPFLMLLVLRVGYRGMALLCLLLTAATNLLFPSIAQVFLMPSALPLKMHMFLLGMLIAAAFHGTFNRGLAVCGVAFLPFTPYLERVNCYSPHWMLRDVALAAILFLVTCSSGQLQTFLRPLNALLNAKPLQWLGDISYSVYLVHLLIAPFMVAFLLHFQSVTSLPTLPRYLVFALAILVEVLLVSQILYRFVELPGIAAGKWVTGRLNSKSARAKVPAVS